MTELVSPTAAVVLAIGLAAASALAAGGAAYAAGAEARARALRAERRLAALYADIEAAIGERIGTETGSSWRDQVSRGLERLASEAASARMQDAAGGEPNWLETASRALDRGARAARTFRAGSETERTVATLQLAERIDATLKSLLTLRDEDDLENALVSGGLNDLFTTEPLLAVYFARDPAMIPVAEAYRIAGSALRLALAGHGVYVETPTPLSIISAAEARQNTVDGRELRRLATPRALANRMADRLQPGESLVVYSTVPGWKTADSHHVPVVAVWNRASWLTRE